MLTIYFQQNHFYYSYYNSFLFGHFILFSSQRCNPYSDSSEKKILVCQDFKSSKSEKKRQDQKIEKLMLILKTKEKSVSFVCLPFFFFIWKVDAKNIFCRKTSATKEAKVTSFSYKSYQFKTRVWFISIQKSTQFGVRWPIQLSINSLWTIVCK